MAKVNKMIKPIVLWLQESCERPFGYVRLATVFLALVLVPLSGAHMTITVDQAILYEEGGIIETLSVVFWIGSLVLCLWALFRWHDRLDRLIFKWFGLLCALAAGRELDAQVLLNPEYFGKYGVHYRIDWFFSSKFEVSILLRVIWGAIFMVALAFLFKPPVVLRKPIIRLIRSGDTAAGLFLLGVAALAIGFINDDILRETHFVSVDLRTAIEETAELLGAIFFFGGICCLLWKPASQHTGVCAEYNEATGTSQK